MQISLVANENEGSEFFAFPQLFCHSSILHRPCLLGIRSIPGLGLGARVTEVNKTGSPPLRSPVRTQRTDRHRSHEHKHKIGPGEAGVSGKTHGT